MQDRARDLAWARERAVRIRRAINVYDSVVKLGDWVDCFHAFAIHPITQAVVCFHRRMLLTCPHAPKESFIYQHMKQIGYGEDPRVFVHYNKVYVLAHSKLSGFPIYKLYVDDDAPVTVKISLEDIPFGKNWMPFSQGSAILAVHSFAPFRVLAINANDGQAATVICEENYSLALPAPHDGYSMFRGGGNVLLEQGHLLGTGHMTIRPDFHAPFIWRSASSKFAPTLEMIDVRELRTDGFGVIDPTSLHRDADGKLWMGLSCSERDWFSGQRFASYLCELED